MAWHKCYTTHFFACPLNDASIESTENCHNFERQTLVSKGFFWKPTSIWWPIKQSCPVHPSAHSYLTPSHLLSTNWYIDSLFNQLVNYYCKERIYCCNKQNNGSNKLIYSIQIPLINKTFESYWLNSTPSGH